MVELFFVGRIVCLLEPLEASKLPVLFRRKIKFCGLGLVIANSSLIGRKLFCKKIFFFFWKYKNKLVFYKDNAVIYIWQLIIHLKFICF